MLQVGYTLWHLIETAEFGESLPTGHVVPLTPETIIVRGVYLSEIKTAGNDLISARHQLGQDSVHLLRVVPSTDGPPFRSALVYVRSGSEEVLRLGDWRLPQAHQIDVYRAQAIRYAAVRIGSDYSWESDIIQGRSGFFLTGSSGLSALWRISRLEADALGRQVLTLTPARLAHGIAVPDFTGVSRPLGDFLRQHFDGLSNAVARSAFLDVVDRANSLAEGILEYCLVRAGRSVPRTLAARLQEARKVLDDPQRPANFLLKEYGFHLAQRIRLLHQRTHANQAAQASPLCQ